MGYRPAKTLALALGCGAALTLGGCTANRVIDTSVNAAAGTTKVAAKGAYGAGKLVYRGGRYVLVRPKEDSEE